MNVIELQLNYKVKCVCPSHEKKHHAAYTDLSQTAGDKNITILHLSCRTSVFTTFTRPANTCTCPFKVYAIRIISE